VTINEVGALCFGVALGYITYRTLVRTAEKTAISDLAAVVAAVGGGIVTGLFDPDTTLFGWYAVGLLAGMAVFFLLYLLLNGADALGHFMGTPPRQRGDGTPGVAEGVAPRPDGAPRM
jgi:hypothetical protein